ncbi:site-specific integrase [Albimonas pacifica]|uniref:Core-binding (CB) domain-containing protein n=1 Tax=Albimonas pacifica TaxID=1114924 RepID=A0A1I3MP79_9RHOB|nr:site-specific integrase [Albimonas pacifica]SFI98787.1 hypothetical protein SAMN05216258_111190 [Albimonas pacifica]
MAPSTRQQGSVRHTKIRGGVYYLNLRIPPELQSAHSGRTHLVHSLGTQDAREAERKVTLARAELFEALESKQQKASLAAMLDRLHPSYREIFESCGGLEGLIRRYESAVGWLEDARQPPAEVYAPQNSYEAWVEDEADAAHAREIARTEEDARLTGKVLKELGRDVAVPGEPFGLLELAEAYITATDTKKQTGDTYRMVVRRFIELHGDLPLHALTTAHLRAYAEAVLKLPRVTSSKKLRGADIKTAIKIAEAKKLARVGEPTQAVHVSLLKSLTAFAVPEGYLRSDPWHQYRVIKRRTKHSAARNPRSPFAPSDIRSVLAHCATLDLRTVDRWAPLIAAYQGARREEIGQLHGKDIREIDGVWCISITDEDEHQKIKNKASLRTIPLHPAVIRAGFVDFARTRPETGPLFMEPSRWGKPPHELKPDARGRFTERYGKRFSRMLREQLGITDPTLVFHSFRHAWEDAADAANMQQSHRRVLAGRSANGDSQAAYGAGPALPALLESLSKIDPAAG